MALTMMILRGTESRTGPPQNLTGGSCVCWPDTGPWRDSKGTKIAWSCRAEGFHCTQNEFIYESMKRIPENQVASFLLS